MSFQINEINKLTFELTLLNYLPIHKKRLQKIFNVFKYQFVIKRTKSKQTVISIGDKYSFLLPKGMCFCMHTLM